jgi:hypothetical protein
MKLLLITDFKIEIENLIKTEIGFKFQSIEIQYFDSEVDAQTLNEHLKTSKYHLCISFSKLRILDAYLSSNKVLNTVNNYIDANSFLELFNEEPILKSYVNKTTSYFNVFLDIEKCISFYANESNSQEKQEMLQLKKLHTYSENIPVWAKIFAENNCNYYTLGYQDLNSDTLFLNSFLESLLLKIE